MVIKLIYRVVYIFPPLYKIKDIFYGGVA